MMMMMMMMILVCLPPRDTYPHQDQQDSRGRGYSPPPAAHRRVNGTQLDSLTFTFTRYGYYQYQYCMVYGIQEGEAERGGVVNRLNSRGMVLQQCGQCRRAGRVKGRLIRALTTRTRSKRISCNKGPRHSRPKHNRQGAHRHSPTVIYIGG